MDAVTYPDKRVATTLEANVVPLKLEMANEPGLANQFGVKWTPGLIWLDHGERPQHRNVGWFEPTQFCAEILYGCAHVKAAERDWKGAQELFGRTLELFPKSFAAPAALYWMAVSAKMATKDSAPLLENWRKLRKEHPDSSWAMKVAFLDQKK